MGINKKLLPIKAHYFLFDAGSAPVFPFIPVIVKELGFSSVAVGWITTAAQILTILIKPIVGSIADKFSCQKLMFLGLLLSQTFLLFSVQWAPSLPTTNSVKLDCHNKSLMTCSEKLTNECYSEKIIQHLNSTVMCQLQPSLRNNHSEQPYSMHQTNQKEYNGLKNIPVELDSGLIQKTCISMTLTNLPNSSVNWSALCTDLEVIPAKLSCDNEILHDLLNKSEIDDSIVIFTGQFWTVFTIIVSVRLIGSILCSFADTLCFGLLEDKPENYGAQRMWGAIGWGLFSFITGYIIDSTSKSETRKNYSISFYISITILLVDLLVAMFIKESRQKKSKSIVKDVKQLFKSSNNIIFLVWCTISGIYVSMVWFYLFWFIEDLASPSGCESNSEWIKTLEGLVITIHCYAGEIPFFFMSGRILRKIGYQNAMTLVLFTFGLRFLLYSSLTNPWWILPIESLNGITFGIFYATMTTYASSISPPGTETTVQNLVGAIFEGAGTSAGSLLGGYLFKVIGSSRTYFVLGLSAVFFGFIHIVLRSILKNKAPVIYDKANKAQDDDEN